MGDFAVIGTRDISVQQQGFIDVALDDELERGSVVLSTGACTGADQYGAEQWLQRGGVVHLHLPWFKYEQQWHRAMDQTYPGRVHTFLPDGDNELAAVHHPRWGYLSPGVRKLHSRNVAIVRPCKRVYACPSSKAWGGGTGMGIKIANHLDIELHVYDPLDRAWKECGCDR